MNTWFIYWLNHSQIFCSWYSRFFSSWNENWSKIKPNEPFWDEMNDFNPQIMLKVNNKGYWKLYILLEPKGNPIQFLLLDKTMKKLSKNYKWKSYCWKSKNIVGSCSGCDDKIIMNPLWKLKISCHLNRKQNYISLNWIKYCELKVEMFRDCYFLKRK